MIRDKRRIDPETGELRERQETAAPASPAAAAAPRPAQTSAEAELAERTADLQRLQAEYLNYKRRVDRERENTRETAVASTLAALAPGAGRHRSGPRARGADRRLQGGRRLVRADGRAARAEPFGEVGDAFDPRIHEALMHSYSDDVDGPVCQAILQVGYRIGDRVVRPARVAVAEPPHRRRSPDARRRRGRRTPAVRRRPADGAAAAGRGERARRTTTMTADEATATDRRAKAPEQEPTVRGR